MITEHPFSRIINILKSKGFKEEIPTRKASIYVNKYFVVILNWYNGNITSYRRLG